MLEKLEKLDDPWCVLESKPFLDLVVAVIVASLIFPSKYSCSNLALTANGFIPRFFRRVGEVSAGGRVLQILQGAGWRHGLCARTGGRRTYAPPR